MIFNRRLKIIYLLLTAFTGLFACTFAKAQTDTAKVNHCYSLCIEPAKVIYDTQRILIQPGGEQKVFLPALYSADNNFIQMTPDDTFRINSPKLYDLTDENILLTPAQVDSPEGKNQILKNISVYTQNGLINVPDYIRHGIYFPVTSFEMISDSDFTAHVFHPVYKIKISKHLEQNDGQTARYEVLCANKVTPDFIKSLCRALQVKGYKTGTNIKTIDSQTLKALTQYQQDNNLPVGGLNLFTLQRLNIY